MNFDWVELESVDKTVIDDFDSGSYAFNDFVREKASDWQVSGEAVTYLCVDKDEKNAGNINRVYGYASINTGGLLYKNNHGGNRYLQCVEIRLFAVARQLRRCGDSTKPYSTLIFKSLLQELYIMSMKTIGFKAIFLNSNTEGYRLYSECGFSEINEYITPDDEKIDSEAGTPMLLILNDDTKYDLYS